MSVAPLSSRVPTRRPYYSPGNITHPATLCARNRPTQQNAETNLVLMSRGTLGHCFDGLAEECFINCVHENDEHDILRLDDELTNGTECTLTFHRL